MEAAQIVGRDAELAQLRSLVLGSDDTGALVLVAEPGLGKTTLWHAAVEMARAHGVETLTARPAEPEQRLGFAGLGDLFEGLPASRIDGLPTSQARALDRALLRGDAPTPATLSSPQGPEPAAPDERAVGPAVLGVLRGTARRGPILVAIDDVHWFDRASSDVLAYAIRRLGDAPVRILLARRPGARSRVEASAWGLPIQRLDLAPLTLGAIRRVIREHLGLELGHHALRRLYERSRGSPLAAIELARVADLGGASGDATPRLTADLDEVLGQRVDALPASVRAILLAVGSMASPSLAELERLDDRALREALRRGVVRLDGERIRPDHPLLAAAALSRSAARERRAMQRRLAEVVDDPGQRLRHRAAATDRSEPQLATELFVAATQAASRGVWQDAADLAREGLRLTTGDDPERPARVIELAGHLLVAGDHDAARRLLMEARDSLPPGPLRAAASVLYADATFQGGSVADFDRLLDGAVAEAAEDPRLHARALSGRAHYRLLGAVDRVRDAQSDARHAVELGRAGGWTEVERDALGALGWAHRLLGKPIEPLRRRYDELPGAPRILPGLARIEAEQMAAQGRMVEARASLEQLLRLADDRGEVNALSSVRLQLTELELRAGDWRQAEARLDEWLDAPDRDLASQAAYDRCRAMVAAGRGDGDLAARLAARAIDAADGRGLAWDRLEATRVLGVAQLAAGRLDAAVSSLRWVWDRCVRAGIADPYVFPAGIDLVEALATTGDGAEARLVFDALADFAERRPSAAAVAGAARCRLLVEHDDLEAAAAGAQEAAWAYERAGLRFDSARTWLALGGVARRGRRWGTARAALETASAQFEELGSPGWVARTASELGRVGSRRPRAAGDLTDAEGRVAALAADGLTNKEIAHSLSVSVDTVEAHLSRVYVKLGVASRVHLARRLAAATVPAGEG